MTKKIKPKDKPHYVNNREFSYAVVYENTIEHSEYIILHQDSKRNWKVLIFSYEFRKE